MGPIPKKKGDGTVMCIKCKRALKFFGNTTNLHEHLKRLHPMLMMNPTEIHDPNDNLG